MIQEDLDDSDTELLDIDAGSCVSGCGSGSSRPSTPGRFSRCRPVSVQSEKILIDMHGGGVLRRLLNGDCSRRRGHVTRPLGKTHIIQWFVTII